MDLLPEERIALKKLFADLTISRISKASGLSIPTLYSMRDSDMAIIRQKSYDALQPLIAPYLAAPDTFIAAPGNRSDNPARAIINSKLDNMNNDELECVLGFILGMPKSSQGNSQGS